VNQCYLFCHIKTLKIEEVNDSLKVTWKISHCLFQNACFLPLDVIKGITSTVLYTAKQSFYPHNIDCPGILKILLNIAPSIMEASI
jgi:hypothetical protein